MRKIPGLIAIVLLSTVACSGGDNSSAEDSDATGPPTSSSAVDEQTQFDPMPPELPDDFSWTGRYLVPDLDVDVPFTWNGRDGDFQMIAGGEDEVIHFTNLIYEGELYTLTYDWPDVARGPCSHVGPFTVSEFNEGLTQASYVGRETLHGEPDRMVHHYRSTAVLELPAGIVPELDDITELRLPLMAGDVYVDADDHTTFRMVLHFGLQNLYDPDLDEWFVVDDTEPVASEVVLPEECAAASAPS